MNRWWIIEAQVEASRKWSTDRYPLTSISQLWFGPVQDCLLEPNFVLKPIDEDLVVDIVNSHTKV